MKTKRYLMIPATMCVVVFAVTIVSAENQAVTRPEPAATKAPATQAAVEPEARDILVRMAEFLAKTPRFSVNIRSNYDVLQESGQMIEFGETRSITLSRPNGLRVEVEQSDGDKQLVLFDGKQITAFSSSQNVYAQASKPGDIDSAVIYFVKDLHMRLPLAGIVLSRFPVEIERRTRSLDYVERTVMDGKPAHHLAGRTATVDYQFWIAEGTAAFAASCGVDLQECRRRPAVPGAALRLEPCARDSGHRVCLRPLPRSAENRLRRAAASNSL